MTRVCPQCQKRYSDVSFEFCLEDGARLIELAEAAPDEPETRFGGGSTFGNKAAETVSPTFNRNSVSNDWSDLQNSPTFFSPAAAKSAQTVVATHDAQPAAAESSNVAADVAADVSPAQKTLMRFAEHNAASIVAVTLALAHNYWQWLYIARAGNFEITTFLVWFLLLAGGAATALLVLRFGRSGKGYAVIGLVMLAVNLLLYLVPKRF